jgi:hypothetical protein
MGRRKQLLLISQLSGEITSKLLSAPDGPSDQGKQDQKNLQLTLTKLSDKRGITLLHTAQNTIPEKRQGH